jgi:xylulokinase
MTVSLGLDLSTQQLKAIIVKYADKQVIVIKEAYVVFDDLKEYRYTTDLYNRTTGGVLVNEQDQKSVKAPVMMWVHSLDLLLKKFTRDELQLVDVVSGCAQQHGSVYWANGALKLLNGLDPSRDLKDQLQDAFLVKESPIWMDSSTTKQVQILEERVGGAQVMADLTGSRGIERFTGAQIFKIMQDQRYGQTERISLVSSFLASLFVQEYAPIDVSDGSGMNLLNIRSKEWINEILEEISSELKDKLGLNVVGGSEILGRIGNYFVEKYGFSNECVVSAFTGDNPASLSSRNWKKGDLMMSLGTSDTLFMSVDDPKTNTFSHVLCHPNVQDAYMAMIVYRNGSLTRKAVRDEYCQSSWDIFNQKLIESQPGCSGLIGFYYKEPEISPRLSKTGYFFFKDLAQVKTVSCDLHSRLIVESQFMAMKRHATNIGFSPERIFATGIMN